MGTLGQGSQPAHCLPSPPCCAVIHLQYLLSICCRPRAGAFCLCYSSKGNESSPGYSDKSNSSSQGQTGAWEQKGVWPLPLNFRLLLQEGSGREQGISPPAAAHHLLPTGPTNGDPLVSCPTPVLLMGTGWRPAQKYVQVSADCCVRGFRASWTERLVHIQPLDIS